MERKVTVAMEPEEAGVCLRYILKHAKRRSSIIFKIFDKREKTTIWWQAGGAGWSRVALQERWQSEWQDVNYQGTVANAPPFPVRRMRTPLPQQSSSSTREEESQ